MRISTFPFVLMFSCVAASASAQTVIEIEGQKPALPQVQEQSNPLPPAPAQPPESSPQPAPPSPAVGRFSFNRVENGFLRLDNENGQVAFCSAQTSAWTCQAVSLDRSALETEIGRLRDEVTALRKEIAALKEPPPPRPPADLTPRPEKSAPDKAADVIIKLPTQEDVARVRDFMEETWRRLVEMITAVQKDMMRRS
jgi:hypothetical protein